MAMDQAQRDFGDRFATALIARDFAAAHGMLAPWLRAAMGPDDLARLLDEARGELPPPERHELESNRSSYEALREPEGFPPRSEPFDPGITADNFRKWVCIELKPGEDSEYDACVDLWVAMIELDGALAVGYLEPSEPD
jgi:hypothetical protein